MRLSFNTTVAPRRSRQEIETMVVALQRQGQSHASKLTSLDTSIGASTLRDDMRVKEIAAMNKRIDDLMVEVRNLAASNHNLNTIAASHIEIINDQNRKIEELKRINRPMRYTIAELVDALADYAKARDEPDANAGFDLDVINRMAGEAERKRMAFEAAERIVAGPVVIGNEGLEEAFKNSAMRGVGLTTWDDEATTGVATNGLSAAQARIERAGLLDKPATYDGFETSGYAQVDGDIAGSAGLPYNPNWMNDGFAAVAPAASAPDASNDAGLGEAAVTEQSDQPPATNVAAAEPGDDVIIAKIGKNGPVTAGNASLGDAQ
jgi:hypothetical protein